MFTFRRKARRDSCSKWELKIIPSLPSNAVVFLLEWVIPVGKSFWLLGATWAAGMNDQLPFSLTTSQPPGHLGALLLERGDGWTDVLSTLAENQLHPFCVGGSL